MRTRSICDQIGGDGSWDLLALRAKGIDDLALRLTPIKGLENLQFFTDLICMGPLSGS
jgi:hypothetical protein